MKRLIDEELVSWKNKTDRKPLILLGARQVGKSYTLINFGEKNYSNVVYLYFENNNILKSIFEKGISSITELILDLEAYSRKTITKGDTLIIFDEIHDCPAALSSLKLFFELANEYHVVAAGSLLGLFVSQKEYSFPVGSVEIKRLYPLNLQEFIIALEDNDRLVNMIQESYETNKPLSSIYHELALKYYRLYLVIGGMPEAINTYLSTSNFELVRAKQLYLYSTYTLDMSKYSTSTVANKCRLVYNSVPMQLGKENKKFQYSIIKSGARAKEYEEALDWLTSSNIIIKCNKINHVTIPISLSVDILSYKVYYSDVGLLTAIASYPVNNIIQDINIDSNAKGVLTENFVAEELINSHAIYYWESNGRAEIDFVIQYKDTIVPIEVKSSDNTKSKSLMVYTNLYHPTHIFRVSTKNFGFENNIKSIPLYALWCIK